MTDRSSSSPTYLLRLMPTGPGDGIAELRALLKLALRRYGLRCTGLRREGGHE
jgi:hypothetical protein